MKLYLKNHTQSTTYTIVLIYFKLKSNYYILYINYIWYILYIYHSNAVK